MGWRSLIPPGLGLGGIPENLIAALLRKGAGNLIGISNNAGSGPFLAGPTPRSGQIRKLIETHVGENGGPGGARTLWRRKHGTGAIIGIAAGATGRSDRGFSWLPGEWPVPRGLVAPSAQAPPTAFARCSFLGFDIARGRESLR